MIKYFCKKCGTDSDTPQCPICGKKLTGSSMHSVWAVRRLPLTDGRVWLLALSVSCLTALLLFIILVGAEFFLVGTQAMKALLQSNLPAILISLIPLSLLFTALMLALQGSEVLFYSIESYGVILRTWHGASRIKCWARLSGAKLDQAVPDENGQDVIMSSQRVTLWKDVKSVQYNEKKGEIRLYHCPHLAPMVLRIPQEEYKPNEALIKKFCKNK